MAARIIGFAGSVRRPSRTRALVEAVAAEAARHALVESRVYDLVDAGAGIGVSSRAALPLPAARIVDAIERADALIVGSPVYKGTFAGLFKHLIDFVEPGALAGKPVVLTATGGGARHALVVEHGLRPLFGFFEARTIATAVYAAESDIVDGTIADAALHERIRSAARELGFLLSLGDVRPALSAGLSQTRKG